MPAVRVEGLTKSYGQTRAVAGVDFAIETGEVVAILGPNGAGKTTTVEMLEGVFTLMLVIGAATFSALGLAVAAMTPSARAAPAVANFVLLPLAFISGIFYPLNGAPEWLQELAGLLPLEPLVSSAVDIFNPTIEVGFP